ncbi:alpha/beta hydrolase fold domain-containing protein [Nocardioides flavescens]|uniref:Alpha/beta hydrolase fold domain-containing protein n=1 Tax=Nocardioides flavescens TaxID=2691959 RepID=A0A6L7F241_9ACTN|nr:alpha/beta hydrolase fold domain-containing protein [Nocardioides flavescens]
MHPATLPVTTTTDLVYAEVAGHALTLDLHRPDTAEPVPVVAYFHGGAWAVGDKAEGAAERLAALAAYGVAVVSANYRLVPSGATHPAQLHDAKAVIRWIRARGHDHDLATDRVAAWGASAGAYLATMLGLTAGDPDLEGEVGDAAEASSAVDAVVDWFGQSDLVENARRSGLETAILAPPVEPPLFGIGSVDDDPNRVRAASPLSHVGPSAPPFLISHGDRDRVTPMTESRALHDALVRAGVESTLVVVGGAGHEGAAFDASSHLAMTAAFLRAHL